MKENNYIWWDHFLYLEEQLISARKYIEFNEGNYNTFSITFMHIILASCADIERLLKDILDIKEKYAGIKDIVEKIRNKCNGLEPCNNFPEIEIFIPSMNQKIKPWLKWKESDFKENPAWWELHNKAKHNREFQLNEATLKHSVDALAGLFSVNLVYHHEFIGSDFSRDKRFNEPKFFDYPGLKNCYAVGRPYPLNIPW